MHTAMRDFHNPSNTVCVTTLFLYKLDHDLGNIRSYVIHTKRDEST